MKLINNSYFKKVRLMADKAVLVKCGFSCSYKFAFLSIFPQNYTWLNLAKNSCIEFSRPLWSWVFSKSNIFFFKKVILKAGLNFKEQINALDAFDATKNAKLNPTRNKCHEKRLIEYVKFFKILNNYIIGCEISTFNFLLCKKRR